MLDEIKENHWLINASLLNPNFAALSYNSRTYTAKDLREAAKNFAALLIKHGIQPGDCVGIFCGNTPAFIIAVHSIWLNGSVAVPLNARATGEELAGQVNYAGIHLLISDTEIPPALQTENFVKIKIDADPVECLLNKPQREFKIGDFKQDSFALFLFTSGSRGKPKGVLHDFNSLYASAKQTDSIAYFRPGEVSIASLPLYHIGGFMIFVRALLSRGLLVLPKSIKAEELAGEIALANPNYLSLVSAGFKQLLDWGLRPNAGIKKIFIGGGYISGQLFREGIEAGFPLVKVYGSTETCSMVTALDHNTSKGIEDSVGTPLPGVEIKILDDAGNFLLPGNLGEIAVKAGSLFKSYFNNDAATANKFTGEYFRTGDFGYINENGVLFLELRREDMIVTGGLNVNPLEIENEIRKINSVRDAFVFGERDDFWGQMVCAAVESDEKLSAEEIRVYLKGKLAAYKIPKKFFFVKKMPRTELGKIRKEELLKIIQQDDF